MTTSYGSDGDTLIRCPINPTEILKLKSLQNHLLKVHKNNTDFVRCCYNFSHIIKIHEIQKHYEECRDRTLNQDTNLPIVAGFVGKPIYGGTDYFETRDTFNNINNETYQNLIVRNPVTNLPVSGKSLKRGRNERRGIN